MREHDYVHKSAGERAILQSLLIQTVGTHVRIRDFCVSERLAMTSSVLHGLQLSLAVINIPAVACVGKHDKTASHLSPSSQHRLSFVWRGTGSTKEIKNNLGSLLTDHLSPRWPACQSHTL